MTTRLNKQSQGFAQDLIKNGEAVRDERDDRSQHQPSAVPEPAATVPGR
jgi:hypothetical protein